jgi:hypothetical protein
MGTFTSEEHLAKVAVGRHVLDRTNFDARGVHGNDDLADSGVRRTLVVRATNQVAVIGDGTETGPDLLAVDQPVIPAALRLRLQRRQVRTRVRLGHTDAPRRCSTQDAGQELRLLIRTSVRHEGRTHLAIGEPHRSDRCAGFDEFLTDDETIDRRTTGTTELDRPGQPDPTSRAQLQGELLGPTIDP